MLWYEIASQGITAPPELEWDIGKMYSLLGYANAEFNLSTFPLSITESDLIKNKYNYLKSLNIH